MGLAHAHQCPCTVRCVCPPRAAPGHGRTCRHRAGILRLRAHPGRGRPAADASAGRRRRPRRTVHLQAVGHRPRPWRWRAEALTASRRSRTCRRVWQRCPVGVHRAATQRWTGTPRVPVRVERGRTGLSPRTVVSLGRAPARPSDAWRRRWWPGHDVHRRPPTPVATLPGPGRPHGCQRPHALLPHDAAVSGRPERVKAAWPPTPSHAVVGPTPQPCRAQGIAAGPLRVAAGARGDVGWRAQRRCAARALMVHGSRFPRRGEAGRGDPPVQAHLGREGLAAATAGWPYSAPRETPQAGPPRGSGLRRWNDGRVSGRTCPERTRRPTRR